jgi:hypothetical protein
MPAYVSRAERERAEWLSWTELLALVGAENPSADEAECRRQIGQAIQDATLRFVVWEDEGPPYPSPRQPFPPPGVAQPPRHAEFWQTVEISSGDPDAVYDRGTGRFRRPLFRRDEAQEAWTIDTPGRSGQPNAPEPCAPDPPLAGVRTARAAAAEDKCGQWLAGLQLRPTNKGTAFEDARARFGTILSRKAFDRAWAANIRPEWKLGGRRRKNPPPEI